jgi:membrane-bound metal-dependent hydrolase YbcI (DUF457 family)
MMRKTHRLGGVAAWLAVTAPLPVPPVAVLAGVPVAAMSSLWPDLDHPQSTAARWLGPVTWWLSRRVERWFGGHRAGTHSLLVGPPLCAVLSASLVVCVLACAAVLGGLTVAQPAPVVAVAAAASYIGAVSHTLLDCLTCNCGGCDWRPRRREWNGRHNAGCEIFWPWIRRRFGLPLLPVGGRREEMVVRPLLGLVAIAGAVVTVGGW